MQLSPRETASKFRTQVIAQCEGKWLRAHCGEALFPPVEGAAKRDAAPIFIISNVACASLLPGACGGIENIDLAETCNGAPVTDRVALPGLSFPVIKSAIELISRLPS